LRLQGARDILPPRQTARWQNSGESRRPRHFMRVTLDLAGNVRSAGAGVPYSQRHARSHGLVDVAPNTTLPAGRLSSVAVD